MKLRGNYFKVTDMEKAIAFYEELLGQEPIKLQPDYYEFVLENGRIGISLNNYGDQYTPSSSVPMFHVTEEQANELAKKTIELGGKMIFNGMADEKMRCMVYSDPFGNELEFNALPL